MPRLLPDWLLDTTDRVDESLWFLPIALTLGSVGGSSVLLATDHLFGPTLDEAIPWLSLEDGAAVRDTLAILGSSIIALTGVVFSMTIVALTLANQQFGPRLLRTFMRDRSTQVVLGTFVATFLHTLLVRHALNWDPRILPRLSIHAAVLLAAVDALLLVYFLHHVARAIHVGTVVRRVADELEAGIEALCRPREEQESGSTAQEPSADPAVIRSKRSGYVRVIQYAALVDHCSKQGTWIEILTPAGEFVLDETPIAKLHGGAADDEQADRIRDAFAFGDRRTGVQDLCFSIDQLVELALRALSPGVNDPESAISCVHRLGQGLARIAGSELPGGYHRDDSGTVRIVAPQVEFDGLVDRCFGRVARASTDHPEVHEAIEASLRRAAEVTSHSEHATELADYEVPSTDA